MPVLMLLTFREIGYGVILLTNIVVLIKSNFHRQDYLGQTTDKPVR